MKPNETLRTSNRSKALVSFDAMVAQVRSTARAIAASELQLKGTSPQKKYGNSCRNYSPRMHRMSKIPYKKQYIETRMIRDSILRLDR